MDGLHLDGVPSRFSTAHPSHKQPLGSDQNERKYACRGGAADHSKRDRVATGELPRQHDATSALRAAGPLQRVRAPNARVQGCR